MESTDALFYTSLYTFLGGFFLALAGLFYKSKCKNIKCCGLCEITRDIEHETEIDIESRRPSIDNPI
jgi:hypothetical protein